MAFPDKNYTLGSGELYFRPYAEGTNAPAPGSVQEYFGNTPTLSTTAERETLDHFDADHGVRTKDDAVTLQLNRTGSFTTDHISPQNLAKWFLGRASIVTQVAATAQTETFPGVLRRAGRLQLGLTPSNPSGVRGVTNVTVAVAGAGGATLVANVDYTVDGATGAISILPGGTVLDPVDAEDITVTYDVQAASYNRVVSGSTEVTGELFFKAINGKGLNQDYYWPKVTLSADGDFELKGEDWQAIPFAFEALKRDDNTEVVYINGRPGQGI